LPHAPETVWVITNTIQRAAIHTCLIFGGYVHRLQGDGLFVYFGGKNIGAELAVERSLQFASVFTYFVQEDLKKIFTEQGIEKIFTRIGVDLGYDRDVIWRMAGIGEISEVTTCSLHTSLASKMQSSVLIGTFLKEAYAQT
jgi:adenylate cyclase